jgi:hypothetical protein
MRTGLVGSATALSLFVTGCRTLEPPGGQNSHWLDTLIAQFQSAPVGNPPRSVYRYTYHGQTVYYVPAQCCDQFSTLYDADGHVLCAPDGGITGKGDGRCPDFLTGRTNEVLIWRDARQRGSALIHVAGPRVA